MRRTPKPIVAMVAGWAIGGGQVLQLVCDLAVAADNARFGQVGPQVGSFDGGFGASLLTQIVGSRKAKEIWFLCRQYDARQALEMGLINTVVPLADLEAETVRWCREVLALSPFALRLMKASFHAAEDGYAGIQQRLSPPRMTVRASTAAWPSSGHLWTDICFGLTFCYDGAAPPGKEARRLAEVAGPADARSVTGREGGSG